MSRKILQLILLPLDLLRDGTLWIFKNSWKILLKAPWWVLKILLPIIIIALIIILPILLFWKPGYYYEWTA